MIYAVIGACKDNPACRRLSEDQRRLSRTALLTEFRLGLNKPYLKHDGIVDDDRG